MCKYFCLALSLSIFFAQGLMPMFWAQGNMLHVRGLVMACLWPLALLEPSIHKAATHSRKYLAKTNEPVHITYASSSAEA